MLETQTPLFIDPASVVSELEIASKSVVADFGCGSGFFSLEFSKSVGENGKVYALDVLPQAIESVLRRVKELGVHNIEARRVNLEAERGTKLVDQSVDVVFLKDVLYQSTDRLALLAEAFRILKSGGRLVVAEWREAPTVIGPEAGARLNKKEIEDLIKKAGFSIVTQKDLGEHHLMLTALKK